MSMRKPSTRSHETIVDLPASAAEVWAALTKGDELRRWFPHDAVSDPRDGGFIRFIWGEMKMQCPIVAWDEGKHLRLGWSEDIERGEALPLFVDFFLESANGGTRLRIVHSGFGAGPTWNKQYDGTQRGWKLELGCLRQYLSAHRGKDRHIIWVRTKTPLDKPETWARLTGPEGLFARGYDADLKQGARFEIATANGDAFKGEVAVHLPPGDFAAVLDNWAGAYFRVALEDCFGQNEVHVWISLWEAPTSETLAFERRLQAVLQGLYAGATTAR